MFGSDVEGLDPEFQYGDIQAILEAGFRAEGKPLIYDAENFLLWKTGPQPGVRRWIKTDGHRAVVKITDEFGEERFDANAEEAAASRGGRWGEGRVARRIPLQLLYNEPKIADPFLVGDQKALAKALNSNEFNKLVTFEGKV